MRQSLVVLAVLRFLSFFVQAHPFIIVNTKIEVVTSYHALPTHILPKRQGNLFDQFESAVDSALGLDPTTSTTTKNAKSTAKTQSVQSANTPTPVSTKTAQTLAPPAVATPVSTSTVSSDPSSSSSSSTDVPSTTSSDSSTSTVTSSTSTTDSSTSTSATSASTTNTTTSQASSTTNLGLTEPTNTPLATSSTGNGNNDPTAGIAVAVIMIFLIALCAAWLVFRYNARAQAWWATRQEKRRQERSYREALDGPHAGSPHLREEALGGDRSKRRTMLQSFFAPSTAILGAGKEIKRKPVNWGAQSPMVGTSPMENEKTSMTASAAPMGRVTPSPSPSLVMPVVASAPPVPTIPRSGARHIIAELDSTPVQPPPSHLVSPVTIGRNDSLRNLPPISPLSPPTHRGLSSISEVEPVKTLPELPATRAPPQSGRARQVMIAKRGSDGVYRLR